MTSVSAFWGDREVSRNAAGAVVSRVLARMSAIDPVLSGWREQGGSRKHALAQPVMDVSPDAIEARLGVNRKEVGGEPISALGFTFAAWNGARQPDDEAAVTATIGLHADNPNLWNAFVVSLPPSWGERDPRLQSLVGLLVESLDPDEVALFGRGHPVVLWGDK